MNKEKIVQRIKETNETIKNFRVAPAGRQLNYEVLAQIIEEFSDAILYLLEEK
jgi:hypothetical protein